MIRKLSKAYVAYREIEVDVSGLDAEKRELEMSFSSEFPVLRYSWDGDFDEVLDHSPEACDLSRFTPEAAGPFLLDHDPRRQVGVVLESRIEKAVLRGRVKIQRSEAGDQFIRDVQDGIRRNASIGYRINAVEIQEKRGERPRVVVREWQPWEVSSVAAGADPTVGVGRSHDAPFPQLLRELKAQKRSKMEEDEKPAPVDVKVVENEARKAEQARCREILAIGARFKIDAAKAIEDGTSVDEFRARALDELEKRQATEAANPSVDVPTKERRRYSLGRVARALLTGDTKEAGLELEISRAYQDKGVKMRNPNGIFVPFEYLGQRDVTKGGTGGELVAVDNLAGEYVPHLLSDLVVRKAGARFLPGLVGDADIPAGDGSFGAAVHTSSETADSTERTPAFRAVTLRPKTATAYVDFTRRMRLQSAPALETIVRDGLQNSILELVERSALNGAGSGGAPQGVYGTSGVTAADFTDGDIAYAAFIAMWSALKGAKGSSRKLAYISSFGVAARAMTTTRGGTGSDRMIAEMMGDGNIRIDGFPLFPTQESPQTFGSPPTLHGCAFGDWSSMLIGSWGEGIEIATDPAKLALSGGLTLIGFFDYDVAVLLPASFAIADNIDNAL